jgi:hypothetical protein
MSNRLYKKYLDVEVGDLVHVDYMPNPRRVIDISFPKHVSQHSETYVYKYPRFTIWMNDGGWISQICLDTELGIYRTNRDLIRFEKPKTRPQLLVDMFASYLNPCDSPYSFQESVDYNVFYVWKCQHCNRDFDFDVRERHFSQRHFADCLHCGKWTNRRVFYMDGETFRYCSEPNARGASPETMHWSVTSEHQKVRESIGA